MTDGEDKEAKIPASQVKGFLREMMDSVKKDRDAERAEWRKRDEAREKEMRNLEKRMSEFEQNPLSKYVDGMETRAAELFQKKVDDGSIEKAIEPLVAHVVPKQVAEQLPQEFQRQRGLISQMTREEIKQQAPEIIGVVVSREKEQIEEVVKREAVEHAGPIAEKTVVELINKTRNKHYETYRELLQKEADEAKWKRAKKRVVQVAAALAILGAGWYLVKTRLDINRSTAAGAVATAEEAKTAAENARDLSNSASSKASSVREDYGSWVKANEEARKKELSGLETKLTGEIAKKADRTELTTQIADIKKDYATFDATLKAELAKNKAREEAYTSYKELADATKKSLDELTKNYDEFSKKAATKEYADAEFARIGKNIADAEANIKKYGGLIVQLQTESGANSKKSADLKELYDALLKNYATITERTRKVEDDIKKYSEKPKENGNNKPLERDR